MAHWFGLGNVESLHRIGSRIANPIQQCCDSRFNETTLHFYEAGLIYLCVRSFQEIFRSHCTRGNARRALGIAANDRMDDDAGGQSSFRFVLRRGGENF